MKSKSNNKTISKLKRYRQLKADITYYNIRLEELDSECLGVSAQPQGERTCETYKITSSVETQAEKHMEDIETLQSQKRQTELEILKIDNALTVLKEDEKEVIQSIFIDNKKYALLEIKLNITYPRIKQLEYEALKKIERYLI